MSRRPPHATAAAAFATYAWGWTFLGYGLALAAGGQRRLPPGLAVTFAWLPGAAYLFAGLWIGASTVLLIGQRWGHYRLRNVGGCTVAGLCLAHAGVSFYAGAATLDAPFGTGLIFGGIALHVMVLQRLQTRRIVHDPTHR